jgi:hypothetical protein
MKLFKTVVNKAKTHDIIYALCMAAPAAINQAKKFNLPEIIGLTGGDLKNDAILTGKWIRANIKYKVDTFENQNIQLPSALLKSNLGDCKSLSLLYLAIMEAAGYNGGFRFAAYKSNNFTHVYNFFVNKNNIYTFDACIKDLKEHKSYTKIKDMKVNYLAGAPILIDETSISMPTATELIQDDRVMSINGIGRKKRKIFAKIKKTFNKVTKGGIVKTVKTVSLAPARGSFLLLVNLNFRGLAKRLQRLKDRNANQYATFWTKLGGDIAALDQSVNKGKIKKSFFGERKSIGEVDAIGEPVTAATLTLALASAGGIIAALNKTLKKENISEDAADGELTEGIDPNALISEDVEPGEDVVPNDPASDGAASFITKGIAFLSGKSKNKPKVNYKPNRLTAATASNEAETGTSFKPSPLLIGGGIAAIAAIYLLTKKK